MDKQSSLEILGLPQDAAWEQVISAYRAESARCQDQRFSGGRAARRAAIERLREIEAAITVLEADDEFKSQALLEPAVPAGEEFHGPIIESRLVPGMHPMVAVLLITVLAMSALLVLLALMSRQESIWQSAAARPPQATPDAGSAATLPFRETGSGAPAPGSEQAYPAETVTDSAEPFYTEQPLAPEDLAASSRAGADTAALPGGGDTTLLEGDRPSEPSMELPGVPALDGDEEHDVGINFKEKDKLLVISGGTEAVTKYKGYTPDLIDAAISCNVTGVRAMLDDGGDVNIIDDAGDSALVWAVRSRCLPVAKLLIQRGANVNQPSRNGFTPYIWSRLYKADALRAVLLAAGADPKAGRYWWRFHDDVKAEWAVRELENACRNKDCLTEGAKKPSRKR